MLKLLMALVILGASLWFFHSFFATTPSGTVSTHTGSGGASSGAVLA